MNYLEQKQIILDSIKSEMESYPSLGLVSSVNSGCHNDMDINTFYKSLKTFPEYIDQIYNNIPLINKFSDLRSIGLHYEQKMFYNTNNINTHKGLIFHIAIFLNSYFRFKRKSKFIPYTKRFCKDLKNDFKSNLDTKGLKLFHQYKIKGAREIPLKGYKIIFKSYSFFKKYIKNQNLEESQINFCLLIFFATKIYDTTLISKIGIAKYKKWKSIFKQLKNKVKLNYLKNKNYILSLNQKAIKEKISPGGCADLVVLSNILIRSNF